MKSVVSVGKTVEEAIQKALAELEVSEDKVNVDILEHPAKGLFGLIGNKEARVEVTVRETVADVMERLMADILKSMQIDAEIAITETDEAFLLELEGSQLGVLIGRRGQTLDALQYLMNLAMNKQEPLHKRIIINIEGYRERREETLQNLARKLADKARKKHGNIVLEPMNAHERRIIHTALQGMDNIQTYSEGEEPNRRVVIAYKK